MAATTAHDPYGYSDLPEVASTSRKCAEPRRQLPTMGGSVPLYVIDKSYKVPWIGVPIVNHDNNQHAANENIRLQNLWDGIDLMAALMDSESQ